MDDKRDYQALNQFIAGLAQNKITQQDFADLMDALMHKNYYSPQTRASYLRLIKWINYLINQNIIEITGTTNETVWIDNLNANKKQFTEVLALACNHRPAVVVYQAYLKRLIDLLEHDPTYQLSIGNLRCIDNPHTVPIHRFLDEDKFQKYLASHLMHQTQLIILIASLNQTWLERDCMTKVG